MLDFTLILVFFFLGGDTSSFISAEPFYIIGFLFLKEHSGCWVETKLWGEQAQNPGHSERVTAVLYKLCVVSTLCLLAH